MALSWRQEQRARTLRCRVEAGVVCGIWGPGSVAVARHGQQRQVRPDVLASGVVKIKRHFAPDGPNHR
ncbi:hypothetical protein ACP70R_033350 [Stipagrostis hirtigluma subsp. patula]